MIGNKETNLLHGAVDERAERRCRGFFLDIWQLTGTKTCNFEEVINEFSQQLGPENKKHPICVALKRCITIKNTQIKKLRISANINIQGCITSLS